jgi:hypothetical protein
MSYVLALKKQKCKNEPQPQDVHSQFKSHEERERYIISVNFHIMIWNAIYFACEPDTTSKLGSRRSQMRQQQSSASSDANCSTSHKPFMGESLGRQHDASCAFLY